MVKSASGKMNMRSFEVVEASKHGGCKTKSKPGRYVKRTPYGAALNKILPEPLFPITS